MGFEPLHDFPDVLGAFARADQKRVGSINDHEIVHARGGDEFLGTPKKIAGRIHSNTLRSVKDRVGCWATVARIALVLGAAGDRSDRPVSMHSSDAGVLVLCEIDRSIRRYAMPAGVPDCAASAGPPSPSWPGCPFPAIVTIMPSSQILVRTAFG